MILLRLRNKYCDEFKLAIARSFSNLMPVQQLRVNWISADYCCTSIAERIEYRSCILQMPLTASLNSFLKAEILYLLLLCEIKAGSNASKSAVQREVMETQVIDDDLIDEMVDRGQVVAILDCDGMLFNLFEGDNIVGRSNKKDLDVILQDDTVSDLHANLEINESGECYCKDLASNNGKILK